MSIRLHYGGMAIECETPEEAVTIVKLLAATPPTRNGHHPSVETAPAAIPKALGDLIAPVVKGLGPNQKAALRLILRAGGDTTDAELRRGLQVNGSGLGGLMAAVTKAAKRAGLDPDRLFQSTVVFNKEGERSRRYHIPGDAMEHVSAGLT